MNNLLHEYGRFCIVVIIAIMFFEIYDTIVFGDHNIAYWYRTDMVNTGAFESSDIGGRDLSHKVTGDGVEADVTYAPHFHPLNFKEDFADGSGKNYINAYKISGNELTYDIAMDIFKPITAGAKTGIWLDDDEKIPYEGNPTILYTVYEVDVATEDEDGNKYANPVVQFEEVPAVDKYGNTRDSNGNPYGMHKQIKYKETFRGELTPDTVVDLTPLTKCDIPPKFKLTYRIEEGNKKAEYQTMFIKDNMNVR